MKNIFIKFKYPFLTIFLISFTFLSIGLNSSPLVDWDENIYAEASKQMVQRGNYLDVIVNNHKFTEKPPFFFWLQSLSYHVFGISEFSARIPSAITGAFLVLFLFWFGSQIKDSLFGFLWGLVYFTSLMPSILAKSAVIDQTFNFFITVGLYLLYQFHSNLELSKTSKNKKILNISTYNLWKYLIFASISMGLAVLTKGPLGGFIPIVCIFVFKLKFRKPWINSHFIFICAAISLLIGTSWYLANWFIYGGNFLKGFIEFQLNLFATSMEGHEGPFLYHFFVGLVGLFPWTPFLLGFKKEYLENNHLKSLALINFVWAGFVLILFSFVSTKLPHYSASMYIPLGFFITVVLHRYISKMEKPPLKIIISYFFFVILMGSLFLGLPFFSKRIIHKMAYDFVFLWSPYSYLTSLSLFFLACVGTYLLLKKRWKGFLFSSLFFLFIFSQSFWKYQVPTALSFLQEPLIEMVKKAKKENREFVFYRFISFAALFYAQENIEMLHTTKFRTNLDAIKKRKKGIYIITRDRLAPKQLLAEYPSANLISQKGPFSMYILNK